MGALKTLIQRLWLAAFAAAALWFAYHWFRDNADNAALLLQANVPMLLTAAVAHVAYFVVTVMAWCRVLQVAGSGGVSFGEGLAQILLVNIGKYIPGKVWGIAARGARLKELGFSIQDIGKASYFEQALLLLTGFWLAVFAAWRVYGDVLYLVLVAVVTAGFAVMRYGGLLSRYLDVDAGFGQLALFALRYLAIWLLLSASFAALCLAIIPIDVTPASVAVFVLALTAGYLAGFLAVFAPGGIGVREGVGAAVLATLVPFDDAVMLMLLFRIWVVLWEVVAGTLLLGRLTGKAKSDVG